MRIVGNRKERDITFHADGALLKEGALFNTEMQKMQSTFRFPRGVFRYKSHEEADRHMMECVIDSMVAVQKTDMAEDEYARPATIADLKAVIKKQGGNNCLSFMPTNRSWRWRTRWPMP